MIRRGAPRWAPSFADAVRVQRYLFGKHDRVARAVRLAATKSAVVDLIMRFVQGRVVVWRAAPASAAAVSARRVAHGARAGVVTKVY